MCGIAGIVGPELDQTLIERMTAALAHRGPDDSGVWRDDGVQLGHRRLAILDTSRAGRQPMRHGRFLIVYNGEIYNFRELRGACDGPFLTECDTEVLIRLYARHGPSCVSMLRGMFAFAIWDTKERRLFAARDRIGIKPFVYKELPHGLAFASEHKALLELGRPKIDAEAVRDYFGHAYVPPPKSVWKGIRQLPPGHTMTWNGRIKLERYWSPSAEVRIRAADEALEGLSGLLGEIVPEHTIADVPVGVFLSGGIDSTTVASQLHRPRTFTLGVDVERRSEAPIAREIARHFGTDHNEEIATGLDLDEAIATIPRVYDEPFGDSSAWATYLVSRMARRHVTVVLSGDGGDELFCGYQWYSKWLMDRSSLVRRAMAATLPMFSGAGRSSQRRAATGLERYAAFLGPFTLAQKRALLSPTLLSDGYDDLWHFREHWREDLEPLKRLQWVDLHTYLPGDILTKVDRASMAWGLEIRPPLLDHRLVEYALSLDTALLRDVAGGRGKLVLRRFMADRVPPGFFDRPKRGFNLPIQSWLASRPELLGDALVRLTEADIIRGGPRRSFTHEQAWTLLVFDRWMTTQGYPSVG